MSKIRVFAFGVLAVLTWATAVSATQQPGARQSFAWNFRVGEQFQLETTTELKQTIKVTNQEAFQQEQRLTLVSNYVVAQKDNDSCALEQTIVSIKVQNPTGGAPGKFYQQLEGSKLRLTLTNKNRELRLDGYEDMLKKVAGDDPNVRRVVQALLPEETLRRSLEESFAFLPPESIALGESWERKLVASLGPLGTLNIVNTYTYEKTEMDGNQSLHRFSVKPKITYSLPKSDSTGLPFQVTGGDLRAEGASGTLWWNSVEGKLARSEMKLKLAGKLKIRAKEQDATLELQNDQSVEIRLTRATN